MLFQPIKYSVCILRCVIQLPGEKETHKIENLYEELEPGAVGGQTGQVINPETSRSMFLCVMSVFSEHFLRIIQSLK